MAKVLKCNPQWLMGFDVSFEMPETASFTYTDDDGKKKTMALPKGFGALLEGDQLVIEVKPNSAFIMDMDDLTKDMSSDQMARIKLFTQFIKQEDDKKSDE